MNMISTETKNIIKSILTTAFVSSLTGIVSVLVGKTFWVAFCMMTILQIVFGYALATYTFYNYKKDVYLAELDKIEKLSTILNCAYCNEPALVTFLPDQTPELQCEKCKNNSSVKLHFTVARQTTAPTPLSEPQTTHNIKL